MKVLILAHPDHVSPEDIDEEKLNKAFVPWEAEYDVKNALIKLGHKVETLGVFEDLTKIREKVEEFKPKIIFNLLEEFCGETIFDQNVVSYLELLGLPYTGCNPKGLILGRDKALSKKILSFHRIGTPKFQVYPRNQKPKKYQHKIYPAIVKCLNEEASLGISKASVVTTEEKLLERIEFVHKNLKKDAIVEQFVEGGEFFVGVYGNYRIKALPVWSLQYKNVQEPDKELYSNRAKFNDEYRERKGIDTKQAKISQELATKIQKAAIKTYKTLGLSGYARIDLRVGQNEKVYVIEANPNPDISLPDDFASSAKKMGMKYEELIAKIIKLGLKWSPLDP